MWVLVSETVWDLVRVSKLSEEVGEQLVEGTDGKKRGTCELLCICGVPWRHSISVTVLEMLRSTKGIHPFINRLPHCHPPKESLSHIAWSYTDRSFSAQLLGAGLFWNSLKENNHSLLQHHYHSQIEWDCSVNTFPPHHHNILMRRRSESATDWEVSKYRQPCSMMGPEGKAEAAKVKTYF